MTYEFDHIVRLIALKGNPSAIEVVLGDHQYVSNMVENVNWMEIIDTSKVAKAVFGLARGQLSLVEKRPDRAGKAYSSVLVARHLQKSLCTEGKRTPLDGKTRDLVVKMRANNEWAHENGAHLVTRAMAELEFEINKPSRPANLDYAADICTRVYQDERLRQEIIDLYRPIPWKRELEGEYRP